MITPSFVDLHCHSTSSDGKFSVAELINQAEQANIGVLAVTDHDTTADMTDFRLQTPIALVQGSEISCLYQDSYGSHVFHILALGFDPHHPKIHDIFKKNNSLDDYRREKTEAILAKLLTFNIDLGNHDELLAKYPGKKHLSRLHLAEEAVRRGYSANTAAFMNDWIGDYGKRLAYVDQLIPFVPIEEAVDAVLSAGGICSWAHPLSCRLGDAETEKMVARLKGIAGNFGALEAIYGPFNKQEREYVSELASRYRLMVSAGSDYHGWNPNESMGSYKFERSDIAPLLETLNIGGNDYAY